MERPFEAYEGDDPYVFVCYSHDDAGLVYPELARLKDAGVHIWYDEGIGPGSEWSDSIATHIERCVVFLYFVTPRSVATEHCRRELTFAIDQSRRVLSVHLVQTELPSGLRLTLSNRQAILRYDEPRSAYEAKLARAIGDARSHDTSGIATIDRNDTAERQRWRVGWKTGAAAALVIAAALGVWFASLRPHEAPSLDRSLAVVPFSAIGGDAGATSYAEAFTEDLRSVVTGYQEIRAVAVEDATDDRHVRKASYVVDGSVQRLGDAVRVRTSLIRTDDHQAIWARTFERPLTDGAVDSTTELASTIGRFVRQNMVQDQLCESVRRTSHSEEAATAYCAALAEDQRYWQGGDRDLELMLSDAQRAIALDPDIPDAYRIVAMSYANQGGRGLMDWQTASRRAHSALDRGLALAPSDPRLLTAQGGVRGELDLDRQGGEASLRASLASDPLAPWAYLNHKELGTFAFARGDLKEAAEDYRRALKLYDADASVYTLLGLALLFSGENDEVIRVADAGLGLVDSGWARTYLLTIKSVAYSLLGQTKEASAALDGAVASAGPEWKTQLIVPLALAGRMDEVKQLFAQLGTLKHPPVEFMADIYAALDLDRDRAFAFIHEGIDRHLSAVTLSLRSSTSFARLREDPRWAEVMKHLESEEAKARARGQSSD